jgi:hypothetical protein
MVAHSGGAESSCDAVKGTRCTADLSRTFQLRSTPLSVLLAAETHVVCANAVQIRTSVQFWPDRSCDAVEVRVSSKYYQHHLLLALPLAAGRVAMQQGVEACVLIVLSSSTRSVRRRQTCAQCTADQHLQDQGQQHP